MNSLEFNLQRFAYYTEITVTGAKAHTIKFDVTDSGSHLSGYYMAGSDGKLVSAPSTTTSAAQWIACGNEGWGYVPAGKTVYINPSTGDLSGSDYDSNTTIQITGVSNVTGNATAATVTLTSGNAVSDVTVTGSGAGSLTLTINGTQYAVNASGKLTLPEIQISGAQWRANPTGSTNWVYLPAGATAMVNSSTGAMSDTSATTLQLTNVSNVTGSATAATLTLASGKAVNDVTVTGSAAGEVVITVGGTKYEVTAYGKLCTPLPNLGLMTKADKWKLDQLADSAITGAHTVAGGITFTNSAGNVVCTLQL